MGVPSWMLDVPCWMLGSRNCCDVTQACSPMPPGFEPLPFGNSRAESQRDSIPKPGVARGSHPWEKRVVSANGVVARWWSGDPTPLGLKIPRTLTPDLKMKGYTAWNIARFKSLNLSDFPWAGAGGSPGPPPARGADSAGGFRPPRSSSIPSLIVARVGTSTFFPVDTDAPVPGH